jgi:hypothetical protein
MMVRRNAQIRTITLIITITIPITQCTIIITRIITGKYHAIE